MLEKKSLNHGVCSCYPFLHLKTQTARHITTYSFPVSSNQQITISRTELDVSAPLSCAVQSRQQLFPKTSRFHFTVPLPPADTYHMFREYIASPYLREQQLTYVKRLSRPKICFFKTVHFFFLFSYN